MVSFNGLALEHASDKLKENDYIVNTAVSDNGLALKFVTNLTEEIVIKAIKNKPEAIQYAREFKTNYNIMFNAILYSLRSLDIIFEYQYSSDITRKIIIKDFIRGKMKYHKIFRLIFGKIVKDDPGEETITNSKHSKIIKNTYNPLAVNSDIMEIYRSFVIPNITPVIIELMKQIYLKYI